jgi:hypothetical protein
MFGVRGVLSRFVTATAGASAHTDRGREVTFVKFVSGSGVFEDCGEIGVDPFGIGQIGVIRSGDVKTTKVMSLVVICKCTSFLKMV